MREILHQFARELVARAEEVERLLHSGNREGLRRLAHQLKGAGGGYGFPQITTCAAALERALIEDLWSLEIETRVSALCSVLRAVVPPEHP